MDKQHNIVGWFEIPVTNMERAIKFYETLFGIKLSRNKMGSIDMAWFPGSMDGPGASGSLVYAPEMYTPSKDGCLIYFSSQAGDLSTELSRIIEAGGSVVMPKTLISDDIGYMAVCIDSEGNRIALHSQKQLV
jgi:predicted enzyme related to lactoylglutathione lyase